MVFNNPQRPSVREMVDCGLPQSVSQALYSHWGDANAGGNPYDMEKLVLLMKRALSDMGVEDTKRVKRLQWHGRRNRAEKRSIAEEWAKGP